jgi:hypothetical protein
MDARMWRRGLFAALAAVMVAGGSPAAADEPTDAAAQAGGATAAATLVAWPDLGIAHRLPSGGINLWRVPLSQSEAGFGQPRLVKNLDYGGFSYDNSRTLVGDFGPITPSDDGTADHVIWHKQPNGGVLVWGVGGGSGTPQLWQDLRTGGWSWADSIPMVADVTGDGWDDLVAVHSVKNEWGLTVDANLWVFPNNGYRLSAPQLWGSLHHAPGRFLMADLDNDDRAELIEVGYSTNWATGNRDLSYMAYPNASAAVRPPGAPWEGFAMGYYNVFQGATSAGWSEANSRQLAGDVDGDGLTDFVTVHAQAGGGVLVWVHRGCVNTGPGYSYCTKPAEIWQDLRSGGWSFAASRQYLADTNNDGLDDLVTVHAQSGNPGELIWRHLSTGSGFGTPQVISDLRTGGWTYRASREGVADIFGLFNSR